MIRQKGFLATLLTTVVLIAIVCAVHLMKDVFVDPGINIYIPEIIIVILSVCIIFKVRFVREILAVLAALLIVYVSYLAITSPSDYFLFRRIAVFLGLMFVCYMLWVDEAVRDYIKTGRTPGKQ